MSAVLSQPDVELALRKLPGWVLRQGSIERAFQLADFAAALGFVNRVGEIAEAANHHPDITIRYNQVTLTLSSHDSGGITLRDLRLADTINRLDDSLHSG
jgi:4a-hydroxytetrahydrobiopterin dehydratase